MYQKLFDLVIRKEIRGEKYIIYINLAGVQFKKKFSFHYISK